MDAGLTSLLFWGALAVALAVPFIVTVPVNRWLIGRGQGRAVGHAYHGGGQRHGHQPPGGPAGSPRRTAPWGPVS